MFHGFGTLFFWLGLRKVGKGARGVRVRSIRKLSALTSTSCHHDQFFRQDRTPVAICREAVERPYQTYKENCHSKENDRSDTLEFVKRMDPDLLFYYHTSTHTRYSEGQLSDFNKATNTPKREGRRVLSRDVSATMFTWRATLLVRGTLSIHTQFQLISPLPRGDIPTRK